MRQIDTESAFSSDSSALAGVISQLQSDLASGAVAAVSTERVRQEAHDTLEHGEKVMTALIAAAKAIVPHVDVVVSKGGITSADVVGRSIGAKSARVIGQILPGISLWGVTSAAGKPLEVVIVPGNVGDDQTLVQVFDWCGQAQPEVA